MSAKGSDRLHVMVRVTDKMLLFNELQGEGLNELRIEYEYIIDHQTNSS